MAANLVATTTEEETAEMKVEDLISGKIDDDPWQFKEYSRDSASWQAAAQKKQVHRRRTHELLGVALVDLSGRSKGLMIQ